MTVSAVLAVGCSCADEPAPEEKAVEAPAPEPPPTSTAAPSIDAPPPAPEGICPREMVRVKRAFCVDRYEAQLIDPVAKMPLSPYYPPARAKAKYIEEYWRDRRLTEGNARARAMELPVLAAWQKERDIEPMAISRRGVVPNAYVSGVDAAVACEAAGKRLCTRNEWTTACRGEKARDFPYGETYEPRRCNVFREGHPGVELYGDPSINHTDPRLNQVSVGGKPLLRRTGATKECASAWEGDAIYDMVGNLDEWIDDPEGTFLGGFFARAKKDGCKSAVSSHPIDYADYSTGVRCCSDLSFATTEGESK